MEERNGAGMFCATAAASAMLTAGYSWLPVLVGWGLSGLVLLVLSLGEERTGSGPAWVTLLLVLGAMTAALTGAERAFPEDGTFPFVSGALLLLLWRSMNGAEGSPRRVANVLGLLLLPVLGLVLLLGLQNARWAEDRPVGFSWTQTYLTAAAAAPWWCARSSLRRRNNWWWFAASAGVGVGLSLLTHGALGAGLAEREAFPLYRAVQTIRILGAPQRLEALVAAVVLMGGFGILLWLGDVAAAALGPARGKPWRSGLLLGAAFLLEWMLRAMSGPALGLVKAIFWGLAPLFALWIVFCTKYEKSS